MREDPGWRPAIRVATQVLLLRRPEGSIIDVLRGSVIFLATASVVVAVVVVVLGAGADEPRIDETTARIGLFVGVGLAGVAIAWVDREALDVRSPGHFAVEAFTTTMRKVLSAAAVGPVGLVLSWASGDASYVLFGTGASLLLMAVGGPTKRRVQAWRDEVEEADAGFDALDAIGAPYRRA